MEEDQLYNSLIISLIIGIIIVLVTLILFKPEKENFTQLYFNDHQSLPEYSQNSYNLSFTIDNHENQDYNYTYVITSIENNNKIVLDKEIIYIKDKENISITKNLKFNVDNITMLQVSLENKSQEIHFWVRNKDKFSNYEDLGYTRIDCLPSFKGTNLYFEAQGTDANGYPILEVRENGKLIQSINIAETISKTINLNTNSIIDLTFTNDAQVQDENNNTIKDRNIIFNQFTLNSKNVKPIYDKGTGLEAFDCNNTANGINMAWSGSLRFKTQ